MEGMTPAELDEQACYRAVDSRDRRFDGVFYTGVCTTGIYCRPSCPARTPARRNVTFHPTAAAAQAAGFRACRRCLPDATPGSPAWDGRADVAGRAMRLISDGLVDRAGVPGLAARLGYSERQLHRILVGELGAGPLALARARRAQTARTLIETSELPFVDVAFAAGFASLRQFNDTIRQVYAASPTDLRHRRTGRPPRPWAGPGALGPITVRLAVRSPFAGRSLGAFLAPRAVPGVELVQQSPAGPVTYTRTLRLPRGPGAVRVTLTDEPGPGTVQVPATIWLADLRDLTAAVERTRRLLDADADPVAVAAVLGADELLGPLVRACPGLRVPGQVDGDEVAVRAVLGQQISVTRARTLLARLVQEHGEPVDLGLPGLTHLLPEAATFAQLPDAAYPMPRTRARALRTLGAALAEGSIALDRSADRAEVRSRLLALPGIGPWTADYIALRALGDPDILLPTDAGTRHALARLDVHAEPAGLAERWRPWRSYAQIHLWRCAARPTDPLET